MANAKKYDKKFYDQVCTEIDRIFDLYGKPTDNCIVLGAYYDTEDRDESRWQHGHKFVCEHSVALSVAGDFRYFSPYYDWDYEYNPHVRPVMHDIAAFTHVRCNDYDWDDDMNEDEDDVECEVFKIGRGLCVSPIGQQSIMSKDVDKIPCGPQVRKLRDYFVDAQKLVKMIKPFMHHVCGTANSFCDDSTNCFWRNYLVIGRDYKFRTFTMRYDAMMQDTSTEFDSMVIDSTLANCGHVKQNFTPTKDYGPVENVRVREPVPFIEWKDWKKYFKKKIDRFGVDDMNDVPFVKMTLKELPISMITDMFLQHYNRGSDPIVSNFFYYEPENKDEDIYALCQNSVYEYDFHGRHQIGFNWYTLCCLHGDTDSDKKQSTKVVETYIGDMTPVEFIDFIRKTFWRDDKEYTGSKDFLHYGLVQKLSRPSYKNFGNYENGTMYCWHSIHRKPWYLTLEQYEEAKKRLNKD